MKLILLFILSFYSLLFAEEAKQADDISSATRYLKDAYSPEIGDKIKGEDEKNFKKLRQFLFVKEALLNKLEVLRDEYQTYSDTSSNNFRDLQRKLTSCEELLDQAGSARNTPFNSDLIPPNYSYDPALFRDSIPKYKLTEIIRTYRELKSLYKTGYGYYENLTQNIDKVGSEIEQCSAMLDEALAPERADQNFKTWMSAIFAALVGITLGFFFYGVFKRSDQDLSKELLSSNGLQFVTLFVLIIAIILFGILDILKGSELAAILSGISGYILGKGTQGQKIDELLEVTKDIGKKKEPAELPEPPKPQDKV